MSFEHWLGYVDAHMWRIYGVTHEDVTDWLWRDAFDAGVAPVDAVRAAIQTAA